MVMDVSLLKRVVCVVVCSLLLAACSSVKVSREVEMPARASGMAGAKKLAVLQLDGDRDGSFGARVEAWLASIQVRGTPYFEVLERKMLDRIVAEQKMVSASGLFDERDAVRLGDLAGADTLVTGGVHMPPPGERLYQRSEQVCRKWKKVVRDGKEVEECAYYGTRYIDCVERSANVDFTIKAVSVRQGNLIFTRTYSGSADDNSCHGRAKSGGDLQNEAIRQVFESMRKDVAPYTVTVSIEFMDDDEGMDRATRKKVAGAMEYAEQQRVDRACEIFREAAAGAPRSPALYYNLGVCAEIEADYERAATFYRQADRNAGEPVELISQALVRVKQMQANQQAVSQQVR